VRGALNDLICGSHLLLLVQRKIKRGPNRFADFVGIDIPQVAFPWLHSALPRGVLGHQPRPRTRHAPPAGHSCWSPGQNSGDVPKYVSSATCWASRRASAATAVRSWRGAHGARVNSYDYNGARLLDTGRGFTKASAWQRFQGVSTEQLKGSGRHRCNLCERHIG
jgi:hypothetical protein